MAGRKEAEIPIAKVDEEVPNMEETTPRMSEFLLCSSNSPIVVEEY